MRFDRLYFLTAVLFFSLSPNAAHSQVSIPDRNPLKLSFRGGIISNNHDQEAELRSKSDNKVTFTLNTDYAALGEVELGIDLLHFRGVSMGVSASGMFARPEIKSNGPDGIHRIGISQMGILKATVSISFNGSDPYTLFELPYHSNKEAVLGITGMIIRTEKTIINNYAVDSLRINKLKENNAQAVGINIGWNWRLGESGWVIGLNGAIMFVVNKSHLFIVETDETSLYSSGKIDFAPRVFTAGLGYHF